MKLLRRQIALAVTGLFLTGSNPSSTCIFLPEYSVLNLSSSLKSFIYYISSICRLFYKRKIGECQAFSNLNSVILPCSILRENCITSTYFNVFKELFISSEYSGAIVIILTGFAECALYIR